MHSSISSGSAQKFGLFSSSNSYELKLLKTNRSLLFFVREVLVFTPLFTPPTKNHLKTTRQHMATFVGKLLDCCSSKQDRETDYTQAKGSVVAPESIWRSRWHPGMLGHARIGVPGHQAYQYDGSLGCALSMVSCHSAIPPIWCCYVRPTQRAKSIVGQ